MWNSLDICIKVWHSDILILIFSFLHTEKGVVTDETKQCHVDSRELQNANFLGVQKKPQPGFEGTDG